MTLGHAYLVAISGSVCAGKSSLAAGLAVARDGTILTTRVLIADHLGRSPDELTRGELQRAGEELDEERSGAWVAEQVAGFLPGGRRAPLIIDAIRNAQQLVAVRAEAKTLHVHLTADPVDLAERYVARSLLSPQLEFLGFDEVRANPTEAQVEGLGEIADLTLDTSGLDVAETLDRALAYLDQGRP